MIKQQQLFNLTYSMLFTGFLLIFPSTSSAVQSYWDSEIIESFASGSANEISMKIDSSGDIHVAYSNSTTKQIKYAKKSGGAWAIDVVDTHGTQLLIGSSLALDASNNPHISYGINNVSGSLNYASKSGGSWTNRSTTVSGWSPGYTAIEVDTSGDAKIATGTDLRLSTYNGAWSTETAYIVGTPEGIQVDIAIDSNDKIYLSHAVQPSQRNLAYTTNASGAWVTQTVDSVSNSGNNSSIELNPVTDDPSIVSSRNGTSKYIMFHSFNGTSWAFQVVDTGDSSYAEPDLDFDTSGNPYVSYYQFNGGNQTVEFATKSGGVWSSETAKNLGNTSSDTSIGLDASGTVSIAYAALVGGFSELQLATREAGNLLNGVNADIDVRTGPNTFTGADQSGGITVDSINVTGDGRIKKQAAQSTTEASFESTSFIGDVFSIFDLALDDATLNGTARITFNYTDLLGLLSASGFEESDLQVYHHLGGSNYETLSVFARDEVANTITVDTTSFSDFGIGVNPEPTTLLLLGSGLLGLLPRRKKQV